MSRIEECWETHKMHSLMDLVQCTKELLTFAMEMGQYFRLIEKSIGRYTIANAAQTIPNTGFDRP